MIRRNTRAMEAMRSYPSMATFMAYGTPVHHLEAALMEEDGKKRMALLLEVAKRVAADANPTDAVRAIVQSFFVTPRDDGTPDAPESTTEGTPLALGIDPEADKVAKDVAKTQREETKRRQDDKRDVGDLQAAATVLALAVRMDGTLVMAVKNAATTLRGLAQRTKDETVRVTLNHSADGIDQAAEAAGTMEPDQTPDDKADQALVAALAKNGAEAAAVRTFCKEWREIGTTLSRERYAQVNLERLRIEQGGA